MDSADPAASTPTLATLAAMLERHERMFVHLRAELANLTQAVAQLTPLPTAPPAAAPPLEAPAPAVRVYPLAQCEHGADDVLVLGTDGLWDVLSNQEVAESVGCFLANCDPDDQHRYTMAAQDLIMRARGVLKDRGWRIANDRLGSGDDISVYIIPLMYGNKQN